MELSYIISALKRRWWVLAIFVTLGNLGSAYLSTPPVASYESQVVLAIQPPAAADANALQAAQLERYIQGQLSVLASTDLAESVAARVGDGMTAAGAAASVQVEQTPDSDIAVLTAVAGEPERAQEIAQAYAEAYLELVSAQLAAASDARGVELDGRIEAVEGDLAVINQRLQDAVQQYLDDYNATAAAGGNTQPVPAPSVIDPAAAVAQETLQAELAQLTSLRNELEFQSREEVRSQIVQNATLPSDPVPTSDRLLRAAGILAGLLLGIAVALVSVQFSAKVLDAGAVAELLRTPVTGRIDFNRSIAGQPQVALAALPATLVAPVEQLCVRSEGMAKVDQAIRIAVAGSQREAGTTTQALAMAGRFASVGYSVAIIDADAKRPFITVAFHHPGDLGVVAVSELAEGRRPSGRVFSDTDYANTKVIGLGEPDAVTPIRRDGLDDLLSVAGHHADVVIVDLGAVQDSAVARQIVETMDAVVLAVPLRRQRRDELLDVRRQLGPVRDKLLPVLTSPHRRRAIAEAGMAPNRGVGNEDDERWLPPSVARNGSSAPAHDRREGDRQRAASARSEEESPLGSASVEPVSAGSKARRGDAEAS